MADYPTPLARQIALYNRECREPGEPEMNQTRLAEILGLPTRSVWRHVNGHNSLKLEMAARYCDVLHCKLEDLLP